MFFKHIPIYLYWIRILTWSIIALTKGEKKKAVRQPNPRKTSPIAMATPVTQRELESH